MPRNRILAALILAVLGAAVYLVIDLRRASREEVVAQFGAHQSLLARQVAHEVESYLEDCAQVLQFLSSFAAVQQRDRVRMAADFRAYLEPRKRLRNPTLNVYAEDGALVYSTDATDPVLDCSGADFFDWARRKENRGKAIVSSRFRMENEAGKPLLDRRFVVATPLAQGTPESPNLQTTPSWRGVLLMTVDLETLLAEHLTRFVRRGLRQTFLLLALVAVASTALTGLVYWNYRLKVRAEGEARQWQEKHQLEEQARRAETRYRRLFEQSPDGVVVIDPEIMRPLEFNETACRQLGYSREEFAQLRVCDYEARETPEETRRHGEQALREERAAFETQHRTKQGELREVEVNVQTLALPAGQAGLAGRTVFHCIFRDITERKRAEEARRQFQQQWRALSARLESLREAERTRIAREIHDELGQMLTALKIDLRWIERKLGGLSAPPAGLAAAPAVNALLDRIVGATEITDATMATVQQIAADLRPGVLDKLGLGTALEYEGKRFQERTSIACQVRRSETLPAFAPEVATALFRIFQECLTNVARHAGATQVEAQLGLEDGHVLLRVQDNGRGITEAEMANPESLGLLGMKERAAALGGEIMLQRGADGGTNVAVRIPLMNRDGAGSARGHPAETR